MYFEISGAKVHIFFETQTKKEKKKRNTYLLAIVVIIQDLIKMYKYIAHLRVIGRNMVEIL